MATTLCDYTRTKVHLNDGLASLVDLLPRSENRVLDVGCGAGANLRILSGRGHEVHGITLSQAEAEIVAPFVQSIHVLDVNSALPPFPDEYFDALLFSHVLEHLPDPIDVLVRYSRLLKPRSHLYIAVPNIMVWNRRLRHLLNRLELENGSLDMDPSHLRFFHLKSIQETVRSAGLIVTFGSVIGHIPQPGIRRLIPKISSSFDRLACSVAPDLFGFHLLVVAQKA
jgi:SAM-dependent methyltransferase